MLLAPSLAVCFVLFALAQRPQQTAPLQLAVPEGSCTQPPRYRVGYRLEPNGLRPLAGGFSFQGLSWVETDLCTPGTLTLTADGDVAGGEAPILDIALNSRVLAREAFDQQRTVKLRVPEAGHLTLGYFNDYYRSDARVATLENFRMTGATCRTLRSVNVPPETGGGWSPGTATATLVTAVPMTVIPCGPGELTLRLLGRAGGDIFPVLRFQQAGHTLLQSQTRETRQIVHLKVTAEPLTITLINPYFKQLADRNLHVTRLDFRPETPSSP